MGEIDDLLAQVKAEYSQKTTSQSSPKEKLSPQKPDSLPQQGVAKMEQKSQSNTSIDNLLNELKSELTNPGYTPNVSPIKTPSQPQQQGSAIDSLLETVAQEVKYPQPKTINQTPVYSSAKIVPDPSIIQEIKLEIEEKEKLAEAQRQQQLAEAKKQEELRQKRKREALAKEAQEWLKKLDKKSEEGLWFEEFSYSYENKLEAAIDYLAALKEVRAH